MAERLFELSWQGGATEHFFRRARPEADAIPWGTLEPSRYAPELLAAVRRSWTEVSVNEYRAAASFAEVVRCMVEAMAPLDMLGMASDFIADEVLHCELAARVAMELGGAAPVQVDMANFAFRPDPALPAELRLHDVMVRVCCIGEAFAAGMGMPTLKLTQHPLIRAVNETIMRDEGRHQRLGALYLEWAADDWDDATRAHLSRATLASLTDLSAFWKGEPGDVANGVTSRGFRVEHLHELGWLESARAMPLAREVAERLLEPLAAHGVGLSQDERIALFA
jgi:hypothetical protein